MILSGMHEKYGFVPFIMIHIFLTDIPVTSGKARNVRFMMICR